MATRGRRGARGLRQAAAIAEVEAQEQPRDEARQRSCPSRPTADRRANDVRLAFLLLVGLASVGACFWAITAHAGSPDAGLVDASVEAATFDAGVADEPAIAKLHSTAADVRTLVADKLADNATPQTLFDVPLGEEAAIAVEAARLGALLREIDADAGARRDTKPKRDREIREAEAEAGLAVSPALWAARIDLDRARLSFYVLPAKRRHELVDEHARRRAAAAATPSEAEEREREAQQKRDAALEAARVARSETERVISEEYARLLDVERAQAAFDKKLVNDRQAIADRREATLTWQRRTREAKAPNGTATEVDAIYDELRKALRNGRNELDGTLATVGDDSKDVPQAGPDPIADLQGTFDATAARDERQRVAKTASRLASDDQSLRAEKASQLLDEVDTLNSERLALLPFLSAAKRSAVTGFTAEGFDQAASEVRQLTLIARYHRYAATSWLVSLRHPRSAIGLTASGVLLVVAQWLGALFAFFWARRRIAPLLQQSRLRAQESDRHERLVAPSPLTRTISFILQVHRPIEWFALALLLSWLLPDAAKGLLEVQIVTVIVGWVLGGALAVVVVNALASTPVLGKRKADEGIPALRLRSLALVGRVVVAFGLVLVITSRLVGPGTIYQWVASTCWLASIPVFLVLIRWWRDVVFRRTERARKKSAFVRWVLANRQGWKSFFAAIAGGVYLFAHGAVRAVRSWVGRFNVTRRVLAYLFRRELDKLEAEHEELATEPLPAATFQALGPDTQSREWVANDADDEIEKLLARIGDRRGGVIAVIGGRGMGKSLLLRHLHEAYPDTLLMQAPKRGASALRAAFGDPLGLPEEATLEQSTAALTTSPLSRAFLLDDAHRLVQPVMGGLATFDALLAAASAAATKTTWVFALDEVLWLFLQRARGARPLFDEVIRLRPWREEQIITLLRARTAESGLTPTFERLLDKLPPNADEIDKREALERRAESYHRLLWDYAAGNPGVALHMWRRSLGVGTDAATHVRFFQAPDTAAFELLPDPALFVLRAVLQLAPATPEEIQRATRLSSADVAEALRYALARTYVFEESGSYTVTWTWLRALSIFLQRRHLLTTS